MPTEPSPAKPVRAWNIGVPEYLLRHLDQQAQRRCCSRSAYVRWLVRQDFERCNPEAAEA